MDRWSSRGLSRRYDDIPYRRHSRSEDEEDYAYSRSHGRDFNNDERRYPAHAERDDYHYRSADYGSYRDRDERPYDGYRDDHRDRFGRDDHYGRRNYENSPYRSSDGSLADRRSSSADHSRRTSSPDRSRRTSCTDLGNPPCNELKLSGLPKDNAYALSEKSIKHQIESLSKAPVSSARVIIDRTTNKSKGFGFVTFQALDDAINFYEKYKDGLILYGDGETGKYPVDIAYAISKARDPRNQVEPEWVCQLCGMHNRATRPVCFRSECKASRDIFRPSGFYSSARSTSTYTTDQRTAATAFGRAGESDRAPDSQPSKFLLVLGLSLNTTTTILAKGVAKLYSEDDGFVDVQLGNPTKTQRSNLSRGTVGARQNSISRAFLVKDKKSDETRRYGFIEFHTVEDAVAALNKFNGEDRFTIASYEVDIAHPHNGIFKPVFTGPSCYTIELAMPGQPMEYWDSTCYAVEEWINRDPPATEEVANSQSLAKDADLRAKSTTKVKKTSKKRKAESLESSSTASPAMASLFGTWSKAKEQLNDSVHTKSIAQSFIQSREDGANCLLCNSKFPTLQIAQKHEASSGPHKAKLMDPETVKKGLEKLLKRGLISEIPAVAEFPTSVSAEPYFDRAKQRRLENGQTEKPATKISFSLGPKKGGPKDSETPPANQTKGLDMMRKMGYSGSGGLGAGGTGRADVLPVSMYAAGVGLGAEGGKMGDAVEEAGRNTRNDRDEYMERIREKVKERFQGLNAWH